MSAQALNQLVFSPTLGFGHAMAMCEVATKCVQAYQELIVQSRIFARPALVNLFPFIQHGTLELAQRTMRDVSCAVRFCNALERSFEDRTAEL